MTAPALDQLRLLLAQHPRDIMIVRGDADEVIHELLQELTRPEPHEEVKKAEAKPKPKPKSKKAGRMTRMQHLRKDKPKPKPKPEPTPEKMKSLLTTDDVAKRLRHCFPLDEINLSLMGIASGKSDAHANASMILHHVGQFITAYFGESPEFLSDNPVEQAFKKASSDYIQAFQSNLPARSARLDSSAYVHEVDNQTRAMMEYPKTWDIFLETAAKRFDFEDPHFVVVLRDLQLNVSAARQMHIIMKLLTHSRLTFIYGMSERFAPLVTANHSPSCMVI